MGWGERALLTGLGQRCGVGKRAGLTDQHLKIVVKHQRLGASGDRAFVAGDDSPARADLDKGRAQAHVHGPPGKPRRYRVVTLPHADPGLVIDACGQHPSGIERLCW